MRIPIRFIGFYVVLLMAFGVGSAQTTVTTTGGTTNTIPKWSGSLTLIDSAITESDGNLGIGTTSPGNPLTVVSNSGTPDAAIGVIIDGATDSYTSFDAAGSSSVVGSWANGSQIIEFTPMLSGNGIISSYTGNLLFQTNHRANQMAITSAGNVGIGITTPTVPLEVNGSIKIDGETDTSSAIMFHDGSSQTTAWNGTAPGGDYAEAVNVIGDRHKYEPGDVMVIDSASPDKFLKAAEPYSTMVAGIYSTKPGLTGHRQSVDQDSNPVPMAMMGIVPTKVTAENGAIKPGDLMVASSTPGYAMKGTDRERMMGAVIGKAMGHLDSGTGVIEVLVSLQ